MRTHVRPSLAAGLAGCVFALALALAGCSHLRTPYATPAAKLPMQWSAADGSATFGAALPERWWTQFDDPGLDTVVETALSRNNDLAVAAFKVREAQLQAGLAEDNQRPSFSASLSTQGQRNLQRGASTVRSSSASATVSYELDLWGRLASLSDAARWEAKATEQDRQTTAQALAGTAANLYWQLGYLNQRIANGEQSVAYALRTLQLVQAQYAAGAVSALEIGEAEQTLASQRATLADLRQQRTQARNALAILFDAPPGNDTLGGVLPAEPLQLPERALPGIAAGLPTELLGRRPDLRAAEMRLREMLADSDATRASYYPTLSLTGALGGSSTALSRVLSTPYALLGAGLTLPFLQVNQMKLQNALARTQYERAVTSFRQTLYNALADVENALSERSALTLQNEQLAQSLASAQRVERLYEVRYRNGSVALRTWLNAQETRRDVETSLAENQFARLKNLATLYRVLGGGTGASESGI